MDEDYTSVTQARLAHQAAYWDHLRRAQPLEGEGVELFALSGKGTVYSFTTVTAPAEPYEAYAPYALALVQLDEGPLVTAQLTDLDGEPAIGMRVEMVIRKLRTDGERGIIIYGPKFRPLLRPQA
ncbi:MAG: Zn-ribbon domain-containing OB-fold protein [Anaerolineae bacterium]|nr:Zn-ribbon domain-containing OB-fold protein [Anaerolineae bacterium]MEB2289297.1 Zn-ribbon domain-containing OB-fold protein [Anaerolineae bacterium]